MNIRERFEEIEKAEPNLSTYLCFTRAIRESGISRRVLMKSFNELVGPEDYEKDEKREILRHLETLIKVPPKGEKQGVNAVLRPPKSINIVGAIPESLLRI